MKVGQQVLLFVVIAASIVVSVPAVAAQERIAINGSVVDELGGAIADARITVRDAAGTTVRTTTSDRAGAFAVAGLPPGKYDVQTERDLFDVMSIGVQIAQDAPPQELRFALKVAGLTERLVVTGRRVESKQSETPQTIEIVTSEDIERSVALDLTDLLKKSSGVDVIQYPGLSSGIGIRGFTPEFQGINKRSLLLIDGRPSGVTNLATLLLDNVERVEVLKGPASSVYGASAMGGVVNVITRHSRGPITGNIRGAVGSFSTSELAARTGGSIFERVDFDANGSMYNQRDDFRMGSGAVRPATSFKTYDGSFRVGADVLNAWRVDGRANAYRARDVASPGDLFQGTNSQGRTNIERSTSDVRLRGPLGPHVLSTTAYVAQEQRHLTNVRTTNPADQAFLPFLSFEGKLNWVGLQLQDSWNWSRASNLVFGLDYELVESESKSYARTGERAAPRQADNNKRTVGVYAENTLSVNQGSTIVSLGGRFDAIDVETFDTPFKTAFTPSVTTFNIFNPSVGVKQALSPGLRVHATAGRAFVPADARALTGFQESVVGGRIQIEQGNPSLKPERSASFDVGLERSAQSGRLDVTYFQTTVSDRVVSFVPISTPLPPAPVIVSFLNALGARIRGMDVDYDRRLTRRVGVSTTVTHYFLRKEELPTTGERDLNVVAANTVRAAMDLDWGGLSGRMSARYVQGRKDLDFNVAGNPQIDYDDFVVVDLSAVYQLSQQHSLSVALNNVLDEYYYEKLGFPLSGRAFSLKYRFDVGRTNRTP